MSSRAEILQWVNKLFQGHIITPFSAVQEIPAKAVGRILNAMFGNNHCPLHEIMFDDETPITSLRNRRKVLQLARSVGYDGKLDATRWAEGKDFVNELCFWRWLRTQEASHPIPPQADFSLRPAGGGPSASLITPLATVPSKEQQLALPQSEVNLQAANRGDAMLRKRARDDSVVESDKVLCNAFEGALKCQSIIDGLNAKECASMTDVNLHIGTCERCSDTCRSLLTVARDNVTRMEKAKARIIEACKERNYDKLMMALKDA